MPSVSSTVLAALSASAVTHLSLPEGALQAGFRAVVAGLEIAAANSEASKATEDFPKSVKDVLDEEEAKEEVNISCECPPVVACAAEPESDGWDTLASSGIAAAGVSAGCAVSKWRSWRQGGQGRRHSPQRRARRGPAAEAAPAR